MSDRWLCVHCHYYQPPRENPWLEQIEFQESAYPFHDWNERITAECYAPNGLSRLLDNEGWVTSIENNYSKISFNFGPTLLSWLEEHAPVTYERILEGDKESLKRFSGHGSAIAQAYNHLILPLANRRDKETQIKWGIRDFEMRFERYPESLWLPETAVDLETLEIMADYGLKYVILAPRQAKRVRDLNSERWLDVAYEKVDPTKPYLVSLPGGKSINAFFYDGPISKAVAFEGLLHNGETFATRLMDGFHENNGANPLVHIATDGETYGHHHSQGEMALTYALHFIEKNNLAKITNYGEYLENFPPTHEAEIFEDSSWSCAHGIERWRSDCGCNSGMSGGSHQKWRAPLRKSFDLLRDKLAPHYEEKVKEFCADPWALRDSYIEIILNRDPDRLSRFFADHCQKEMSEEAQETLLKALEMQRHLLLMYTSCAWFFDEISGLEAVQCMKYAYRAIQLAEELTGVSLINEFKNQLSEAPSNIAEIGNGVQVLEKYVAPARVDLLRVGAHYAVTSLFEDYEEIDEVYCYKVERIDFQRHVAGKARMGVGTIRIRSEITLNDATLIFAVIHFGDHNINAGVRYASSDEQYEKMKKEIYSTFQRADFPEAIRGLDKYFGSTMFSLKDLFYDEQTRILRQILDNTLGQLEANFRNIYENHYPLMCFLSEIDTPLPKIFLNLAEFIHNAGIRGALADDDPNTALVRQYAKEAQSWKVNLDGPGLGFEFEKSLEKIMDQYEENSQSTDLLQSLLDEIRTARSMPFDVDFWSAQNRYFTWKTTIFPSIELLPNKHARDIFLEIGRELKVRLPS